MKVRYIGPVEPEGNWMPGEELKATADMERWLSEEWRAKYAA